MLRPRVPSPRGRPLVLGAWLPLVALAAALVLGCSAGSSAADTSDVVVAAPFASGERLTYSLHGELDAVVGRGVLTATHEGETWVLEQQYEEVGAPADVELTTDRSRVVTDERLQPLSSERIVERGGAAEIYRLDYRPADELVLSTVVRDGEGEERELRLREHVFDNESSLWLWRTLDLGEGYEARYVSMNGFERSQQAVELTVTDRVELDVPAGTFDVWRLQIRSGRATRVAWIEVAPPHRVVQWDNGATILRLESSEIQ